MTKPVNRRLKFRWPEGAISPVCIHGLRGLNFQMESRLVELKDLYACFYFLLLLFLFSPFIFISWRLSTLQYCSGFCHTLTWISHGFTCVPHPDPPSHLPLHSIPLGLPSAPALSIYLMHPTWAGDLFHPW